MSPDHLLARLPRGRSPWTIPRVAVTLVENLENFYASRAFNAAAEGDIHHRHHRVYLFKIVTIKVTVGYTVEQA